MHCQGWWQVPWRHPGIRTHSSQYSPSQPGSHLQEDRAWQRDKTQAGAAKKLKACHAVLPQVQWCWETLPKPPMNLLAPSSRGQCWYLLFPRKQVDRVAADSSSAAREGEGQNQSSEAFTAHIPLLSPNEPLCIHQCFSSAIAAPSPLHSHSDEQRKVPSLTLNSLRERDKRSPRPTCFIAPLCIVTCVIFCLK